MNVDIRLIGQIGSMGAQIEQLSVIVVQLHQENHRLTEENRLLKTRMMPGENKVGQPDDTAA